MAIILAPCLQAYRDAGPTRMQDAQVPCIDLT